MSESTTNDRAPGNIQTSEAGTARTLASAGTSDPVKVLLNANDLRALAEAADGMRKKPAYIVRNYAGEPNPLRIDDKPGDVPIVIELFTDDKDHPRRPVVLGSKPPLTPPKPKPDHPEINIDQCDAIFSSLSAVEKFLVPYYSHLKPLEEVILMRDEFASSDVQTAAFHLPSSYEGLATGGVFFATAADGALQGMTFEQFIARRR